MCAHDPALSYENILADSLVRLVMMADGVSEAELRLVFDHAREAVVARNRVATDPETAETAALRRGG